MAIRHLEVYQHIVLPLNDTGRSRPIVINNYERQVLEVQVGWGAWRSCSIDLSVLGRGDVLKNAVFSRIATRVFLSKNIEVVSEQSVK